MQSKRVQHIKLSESYGEKIIGTWKYTESYEGKLITRVFTFLSDKTSKYSSSYVGGDVTKLDGTWEIKDNKSILTFEGVQPEIIDYKFSNRDKTLTITDHISTIIIWLFIGTFGTTLGQ